MEVYFHHVLKKMNEVIYLSQFRIFVLLLWTIWIYFTILIEFFFEL